MEEMIDHAARRATSRVEAAAEAYAADPTTDNEAALRDATVALIEVGPA